MTISRDQKVRLAAHAIDCRPNGAPRWDPPGILAALDKVQHLGYVDVSKALTRAAEDRLARTPAVITNLQSSCWRERDPDQARPRQTYDPAEFCGDCSKPLAGHVGDHEPVRADKVRARAVDSREGHAERLKREAAAALAGRPCACGPNCTEHRSKKTTDPEEKSP